MLRNALPGLGLILGLTVAAPPAEAAFLATLLQVGPDVVATGAGSLNITGLADVGAGPVGTGIGPSYPILVLGPTDAIFVPEYKTIAGATAFGTGGYTDPTSGSGDRVGVVNNLFLVVPAGYVSDAPLSSSMTWANQTFASLGVTPGSYTWSWGSGATADSFTLTIAVPAPAALPLFALGLAGLAATRRRA